MTLPEVWPARTSVPMTLISKERVMAFSRPLAKMDRGLGGTTAIGAPGSGRMIW
jgi:hypothetical protein